MLADQLMPEIRRLLHSSSQTSRTYMPAMPLIIDDKKKGKKKMNNSDDDDDGDDNNGYGTGNYDLPQPLTGIEYYVLCCAESRENSSGA